jgi:hypothetical protein
MPTPNRRHRGVHARPPRSPSDPAATAAVRRPGRPTALYATLGAIGVVAAGIVVWRLIDPPNGGGGGGGGGTGTGTGTGSAPPTVTRLAATEALRAELRVLGWSRDSNRFFVELAYGRRPGEPTPWRVVAEYDALREDAVTRWWDHSDPGHAVDGEVGWGAPAPGRFAEPLEPLTSVDRARLAIELCDPPSSRKAPTAIEPADGFIVRWAATGAMPATACARPEDRGLVVVRDRTQGWSRMLRYAYKPGRLPGAGHLSLYLSPDRRRVAIAIIDRADDGGERSLRVFNRALGAQVHVVARELRTARAAVMRLERVGLAATYEVRPSVGRRILLANDDAGPIGQEAGRALGLDGFVVDATADDSLKWRDVIIELGAR